MQAQSIAQPRCHQGVQGIVVAAGEDQNIGLAIGPGALSGKRQRFSPGGGPRKGEGKLLP